MGLRDAQSSAQRAKIRESIAPNQENTMRRTSYILYSAAVACALLLGACGGPAAPSTGSGQNEPLRGTITVSGAFALYPMMTVWADEFTKLHPDVQFDVQGGGAGKGMTDTLAGAVDIGMISRAIRPEEEAKGAVWVSVAKDAVFPIVSASNPVLADLVARGMTNQTFEGIFVTGEIKTWGEAVGKPEITDEIHVYTRADACGAGEQWALFSGGKVQTDIQGVGLNGEPALVDTVGKDPQGIGYANLNSSFDLSSGQPVQGIVVAPIDIDGNGMVDTGEYFRTKEQAVQAIADGTYPSPPARFENLATKGKPKGPVLAFMNWVLTDGQALLNQAGYVPLSPDQQAESLAKIK
jgi:phosphate transport system substrate-binding protein